MRASSSPTIAPSMPRMSCASSSGKPADVHEAAHHVGREAGALLVGEEPDGQRAGELEAGGLDRLDHLQPGEHAEVAVVAAARGHRVDVRAGHHRRLIGRVWHPPDHVADRVDRDLEPEIAHPRDHEIAAGPVLVGERQPGTALRIGDRADARQLVETVDQAGTVDAQRRPIRHGSTVPTFYKSSKDASAGLAAGFSARFSFWAADPCGCRKESAAQMRGRRGSDQRSRARTCSRLMNSSRSM